MRIIGLCKITDLKSVVFPLAPLGPHNSAHPHPTASLILPPVPSAQQPALMMTNALPGLQVLWLESACCRGRNDTDFDLNVLLLACCSCMPCALYTGNQSDFIFVCLAGSADHTVRLWGAPDKGQEQGSKEASVMSLLKTLPTKATPVFNVAFTPMNLLLASGALTLRR